MKNISVNVKEIKEMTKQSEGTGRFEVSVSLSLYTIPDKISLSKEDSRVRVVLHYLDDYAKKKLVKYSDHGYDFYVTMDEGILTEISIKKPLPEEIDSIVVGLEKSLEAIQLKPSSKLAVGKTLERYQGELTDYFKAA